MLTNLTIKKKSKLVKKFLETSACKQRPGATPAAETRTIGLKHVFGILSARTKERQPKQNNGEAQLGLGITVSNNYILRIKDSGFSRVSTEGGKKPSDFCFRWQQILLDRRYLDQYGIMIK